MKTNHTPGPWFFYVTPSGVRYKVHGQTVDHFICDIKGANDLANARLIASAPDMLSALRNVRDFFLNNNITGTYLNMVEETITKATGGIK